MASQNDQNTPKKGKAMVVYVPKKGKNNKEAATDNVRLSSKNASPEKDATEKSNKRTPAVRKKKITKQIRKKKAEVVLSVVNVHEPKSVSAVKLEASNLGKGHIRCRPGGLAALLNDLNSEEKRQAIRDIGFGGLLHVAITKVPRPIVPLLIEAFGKGNHYFKLKHGKSFLLSKDDVCDCFQIPNGPNEVPLLGTRRSKESTQEDVVELKRKFNESFGVKVAGKSVLLGKLDERMRSKDISMKEFKQLFVLYSMCSFLAPTSNGFVDVSLLRAVEDVERISSYDWCSFVFKKTVEAFKVGLGYNNLLGCIPFVMICYFHRFNFKGEVKPSTLPLIQHWTDDSLEERVKGEMECGALGDAPKCDILYPLSRNSDVSSSKSDVPESIPKSIPKSIPESIPKSAGKKVLILDLPEGVDDDEDIRRKAIDETHVHFLTLKRDSMLFDLRYSETMREIRRIIDEADTNKVTQTSSPLCTLSPSQAAFFSNPDLHRYCDEVVKLARGLKEAAARMPSYDTVFPNDDIVDPNNYEVQLEEETDIGDKMDVNDDVLDPNNDEVQLEEEIDIGDKMDVNNDVLEGIDIGYKMDVEKGNVSSEPREIEAEKGNVLVETRDVEKVEVEKREVEKGNVSVETREKMDVDKGCVSEAKGLDQLNAVTPVIQGVLDDINNEPRLPERNIDVYVPFSKLSNHPFLLHTDRPLSCMTIVPENLGCSTICGAPNTEKTLVSRFMLEKQSVFEPVFSLRKDVIDYAFFEHKDYPGGETLASFNVFNCVERKDITQNVYYGLQIEAELLDCWAILLNHLNTLPSPIKVSRCFFGLNSNGLFLDLFNSKPVVNIQKKKEAIMGSFKGWTEEIKDVNLGADLIFISILSAHKDHFFCVCLNFINNRIDYLDNRLYEDDILDTKYGKQALTMAQLMGEFLVKEGHKKGSVVKDLPFFVVDFPWKAISGHNNDCGVFTMVHELLYCGGVFDCDLGSQESRDRCRGEIVATLILSDINLVKNDVLDKLNGFIMWKDRQSKPKAASKKRTASGRKGVLVIKRSKKGNIVPERTPSPPNKRSKKGDVDPERTPSPPSFSLRMELTPNIRTVLGSKSKGRGDGLGCSEDTGDVIPTSLVVSKYLIENISNVKNMKIIRKNVADYAFLDDYVYSFKDILVKFEKSKMSLLRSDIITLKLDMPLSSEVVNYWSYLLNHLEYKENAAVAKLYLGCGDPLLLTSLYENDVGGTPHLTQIDKLYEMWDASIIGTVDNVDLKVVDLFFIPVLHKTFYFCVCINFKAKRVEVLDTRVIPNEDWTKHLMHNLAKFAADKFIDYLESKEIEKASQVSDFEVVYIPFKWQNINYNDSESGNFLLMHMLDYEGEPYESNMMKKDYRRTLSIEIAATLILADINTARDGVIGFLKKFCEEKPDIKKRLLVKRLSETPILRREPRESEAVGVGRGRGRATGRSPGKGGKGRGRGREAVEKIPGKARGKGRGKV